MKREADKPAKARGRPRSFDRDEALERAMELFWRQGYEATSLADLTAAMGINPPSLYAAFGDKEHLFLAAVERYENLGRGPGAGCILEDEPTARGAIERILRESAIELSKPSQPKGCMLITAATNCSAESAHVQRALADRRAAQKKHLKERIAKGIADGELARGTDAGALADFYATVLTGMSMQSRDGATRKTLLATAEAAMRAWPE
ncbi:MAG TPA: TetR/AcrR family transcriptional regulator [Burkholderiaceae bacterium]|nr:TetR/AcrR family transcriptional regulator [Burkholderiaceae bacterium]